MSTIMGIDISKKTMNVAVIMETKTIVEDKYSLDILSLNEIRNLYEQYQAKVIVFGNWGLFAPVRGLYCTEWSPLSPA